ncbi:MAG TPA: DNA-processing protein DprA, partial [Tissierellaceae bacterium]|nr:DNA-processing protein DprA [Tissierellaceae bacterium]
YKEVEENGALISEFPLGMPPLAYNFPRRNRIIAGLSLGIIVIEAEKKSGSLITAHHALEQGKDVFALPGNINSIYSQGTNRLIRDGARPLLEIDDILEEIKILQDKISIQEKDRLNLDGLSKTEQDIVATLKEGPIHSDLIAHKTGLEISTVIGALTILEMKGIVKELNNGIFTLSQ